MEVNPVAEGYALALGNGEIAGSFGLTFEVVDAEGIGGEEAVVSDVPPGGMAGIGGVIEDGDADSLAVDGAAVIAPGGAFAPGGVVAEAVAVEDVALGYFTFEAHGGGESEGHTPFFSVA